MYNLHLMKIPRLKIWKKLPKPVKTKRAILVPVVVFILAFVLTRGGGDHQQIKTAQVSEKTLQEQIVASGKIESENEANLRFLTSGKLAVFYAKEGNYVRRGQTIAQLDTQELKKRLEHDLNLYFKTRLDFEDVKDTLHWVVNDFIRPPFSWLLFNSDRPAAIIRKLTI